MLNAQFVGQSWSRSTKIVQPNPVWGVLYNSWLLGERLVFITTDRTQAMAWAKQKGAKATVVRIYRGDNP